MLRGNLEDGIDRWLDGDCSVRWRTVGEGDKGTVIYAPPDRKTLSTPLPIVHDYETPS